MKTRANINNIIHEDIALKHGYTLIPNIVLDDESISNNAQLVYLHLLKFSWGKGSCYPGHQKLAEKLKLSRRSIIRALQELKAKRLIDWKQRGLNKTNIYIILDLSHAYSDEITDVTPVSIPEVTPMSQQDVPPMAYKEYKDVNNIKIKNIKLTLNDEFNSFSEEVIELAKELNDLKSIKYYQKLISQKNKGIVNSDDVTDSLIFTRTQIRTAQVDGTKPPSNPAGLFVKTLKDLLEKRKQKEQLSKLEEMRTKFLEKSKF
jgi:hypothetical protein